MYGTGHQTKQRAARRRMAAKRPQGRRSRRWPLRRRNRRLASTLTADCLARQPKRRLAPRRMALLRARGCRSRRSSLRRRSRHPACPLTAARAASQPRRRAHSPRFCPQPPPIPRHRATFLRLSGDTSGFATEDAAVIAILSPGAAAPLPICSRSTTCCRSPRAVARTCSTYAFSALPIAACATAMGRLCRRNAPCSASSAAGAPVDSARRRLAGGRGWAGHPSYLHAPSAQSSPPHHQILAVVCHLRPSRFRRSAPSPTIRSAAPLAHRL